MSDAAPCAPSPSSQSGKFQRKLDAALGMGKEDDDFYTMETPLLSREDHECDQEAMPVNPLHESFAREVAGSPDLLESWSRRIESEPWVKAYERHPLVQSASREERRRILPIALNMDATQFAKRDSLLVFTARMLPSGTRHLAKHRCAIAGVVVGALSSLCADSPFGALCRWRLAKTLRPDTMGLRGSPATTNAKH